MAANSSQFCLPRGAPVKCLKMEKLSSFVNSSREDSTLLNKRQLYVNAANLGEKPVRSGFI